MLGRSAVVSGIRVEQIRWRRAGARHGEGGGRRKAVASEPVAVRGRYLMISSSDRLGFSGFPDLDRFHDKSLFGFTKSFAVDQPRGRFARVRVRAACRALFAIPGSATAHPARVP